MVPLPDGSYTIYDIATVVDTAGNMIELDDIGFDVADNVVTLVRSYGDYGISPTQSTNIIEQIETFIEDNDRYTWWEHIEMHISRPIPKSCILAALKEI